MSTSTAHQEGQVNPPSGGGRRRASLVDGRSPATPDQRISLNDVASLQADQSPEARAGFAIKFGQQYDTLTEGETRSLADAILSLLVKDVEQSVRQALTETVAFSPNLPAPIVNRLARDEIDIARPILEQSPVLSDDELAEIVHTHAMQYALAVAGRDHLSEGLSDILAEMGDAEVTARLVDNHGAVLSTKTLQRIAQDCQGDPTIQDRLIRRPALPYELVDQLVTLIGDRLEWELVRKRRMSAEEAHQLMAATRDRATLSIVAREHGEHSLERELRQRYLDGELGPQDVLVFLRDGEVGSMEAGLALLTESDVPKVRQLLYGTDKRGLAALSARAGFAAPQYVALRMALDLAEQGVKGTGETSYKPETMRFVQDQYERMQGDEAAILQWFGM